MVQFLLHPLSSVILLLRFLVAVVISGWQTILVILKGNFDPAHAPQAGFVRMRFAPMDETGAALLGCLISLTPGTTTIDIDMARREMLLHMLDTRDPDGAIDGIRRDFERYVVVIFGEKGRTA
ncbi:hypothetical protein GTZ97_11795 [Aquabacterium fontiphilum]|uniref:Na+/H+ antiporter subunit E n=1 Tax=Aquabacterium fontiphilum TaxID=450365 RepID=UPI0013780D13|nr:Na+/H+ antiporter subunit E [Aquabacterium fontiphilum]NBD21346.1 hypothetical protein [Aquabacterium fontiphilum]